MFGRFSCASAGEGLMRANNAVIDMPAATAANVIVVISFVLAVRPSAKKIGIILIGIIAHLPIVTSQPSFYQRAVLIKALLLSARIGRKVKPFIDSQSAKLGENLT